MKIVINKCYGGFGVSLPAMKEMLGKCQHVQAHEPIEYFGSREKWQETLATMRDRDYWYFDEHDWPVTDEHRDDGARSCPVLVETVERMKEAASGSLSNLRIVEIPDGVSFEISDYDGVEHIAETHQTWG